MNKKIAFINYSGSVGKSTIAENIFLPRFPSAKLVCVETVNTDAGTGADGEKLKAAHFDKVQERLFSDDAVMLDVGSSNAEGFISQIHRHIGSQEDIDCFVVPCVPGAKAQEDTILTLLALKNIGVKANRIKVLFNRVPRGELPQDVFPAIFGLYKRDGGFELDETAFVEDTEVFESLRRFRLSAEGVASDETDYRKLLSMETVEQERARLTKMVIIQRLVRGLRPQFDQVFDFVVN